MQDLVDLMPLPDAVVKLEMPEQVLLLALENAVSAWPKLDGRFMQVREFRACQPKHIRCFLRFGHSRTGIRHPLRV